MFCSTAREIQDYIDPIIQKKKECKLKKIFSNKYHELKENGIWEVADSIYLLFEDSTCIKICGFVFGQLIFDDEVILPEDEYRCFDFFNTTQGRYCGISAVKEETISFQMEYGEIKTITGEETNGILDLLIIETEGGEIRIHPTSTCYCKMELWSPHIKTTATKEEPTYCLILPDLDEDISVCLFVNKGESSQFDLDVTMSFITDLHDFRYRIYISKSEIDEFSNQIEDFLTKKVYQAEREFFVSVMEDISSYILTDCEYFEYGKLKFRVQWVGEHIGVYLCDYTQNPPMRIEYLSDRELI